MDFPANGTCVKIRDVDVTRNDNIWQNGAFKLAWPSALRVITRPSWHRRADMALLTWPSWHVSFWTFRVGPFVVDLSLGAFLQPKVIAYLQRTEIDSGHSFKALPRSFKDLAW